MADTPPPGPQAPPPGPPARRPRSREQILVISVVVAVVLAIVAAGVLAAGRGRSLAQLALAWALRDPRMTSVIIGACSVAQLEANVAATGNLDLTDEELSEIDQILAQAS